MNNIVTYLLKTSSAYRTSAAIVVRKQMDTGSHVHKDSQTLTC